MATTPGTELIELETGIFARLHEGLTNAGIIVGDDGVLVIDSLRVPSFARDLIRDVRHITDKPVQYLVDTHSHWDHSWGNEEFPDATIIGHENCYDEMVDVEWNRQWREKVMSSGDPWAEEAGLVTITPPNLTFETSMRLYFGGRELHLRFLGRAHTGGDTHIHLPDDGIVFCGDVAQDGGMPFLADSYPSEWPATDDRLVDLQAPRFVSGHGPVGAHSALVEARDFIHDMVGNLEAAARDGRSAQDAASSTVAALASRYGDWRGFERLEEALPEAYGRLG